MRGDRRDDLRLGDAAQLAGMVPVGLHRQQDALGPAGTHRADHRRSGRAWPAPSMEAVIETISASNLVALGHRSGCKRVALRVRRIDAAEERHVLRIAVVHGAGRVPLPPGALLGRCQPLDQAGHFGPWPGRPPAAR